MDTFNLPNTLKQLYLQRDNINDIYEKKQQQLTINKSTSCCPKRAPELTLSQIFNIVRLH